MRHQPEQFGHRKLPVISNYNQNSSLASQLGSSSPKYYPVRTENYNNDRRYLEFKSERGNFYRRLDNIKKCHFFANGVDFSIFGF